MQIKIGTLHVKEADLSENHTSYAADWRAYKQAAQDVPLFMTFTGGFNLPMPSWVMAEWPIYVYEEQIVNNLWGVTSHSRSDPHWSNKAMQTYLFLLKDMNFTPNPNLPDSDLLAENSVEWARKHTPTWDDAKELSIRCQ